MASMIPQAGLQAQSMDWAGLSRRRFLKGALVVAGAASAAPLLGACSSAEKMDADGRPLLFLDSAEVATLTAVGEAAIPAGEGFPGLAETGVIRRIDEEMSFVGAAIQGDVHAAIDVMEYAPFIYGRFGRYSRLELESRRDVLKSMMRSRSEVLRAVGTNLKIMVHFFYFGHPATWPVIGYDGPFAKLPPKLSVQRRHYAEQTGAAS